ncbi:MAG: hypothetical protein Q7T62_02675 [Undibacterium sp.]|nr:hypothetical protein [Undibacterium sp.]
MLTGNVIPLDIRQAGQQESMLNMVCQVDSVRLLPASLLAYDEN